MMISILLSGVSVALPAAAGAWLMTQSVDPMTDERSSYVGVMVAEGTLAIGCKVPGPDSVRVSFTNADYLGEIGAKPVYRVDEAPAVELTLGRYSAKSFKMQYPESRKLIAAMRDGKVLQVRLFNYRGERADLAWPIEGANLALDAILAACGDGHYKAK